MVKLADTLGSGPSALNRHGGSSPLRRKNKKPDHQVGFLIFAARGLVALAGACRPSNQLPYARPRSGLPKRAPFRRSRQRSVVSFPCELANEMSVPTGGRGAKDNVSLLLTLM